MRISADGRMLTRGNVSLGGLYDDTQLKSVYLQFSQADYWTQLTNNYSTKKDIAATMTVDGKVYPNVGVRFKGQTSYQGAQQKKSFNISMDFLNPDQKWEGYKTLNLNNAHQDASLMKEVLYEWLTRQHSPAAQTSFVKLYINNEYWGLYANVQQLNKDFLEEWFPTNDGTNWRADATGGTGIGGPGGGGMWGDGKAAINYLGADSTSYKSYYTVENYDKQKVWDDLIRTAQVLNQTPLDQLEAEISKVMDLDATLWFLANEIYFTDDDSYVYKGKMDYYLYWDEVTGRILPFDYDGNSALGNTAATSWSPFYNETKVNYPLMNRLFAVPSIRQRYLAHIRTIMNEVADPAKLATKIDQYNALIEVAALADTKKQTTNTNYPIAVNSLKQYFISRKNYISTNAEVNRTAPTIANVSFSSSKGEWKAPNANEKATVKASISGNVKSVNVYYATGFYDNFLKMQMLDDGKNGDGVANDGVFGATLPAYGAGVWVRYYIEVVANDGNNTVRYEPAGAEHNVYIYQVNLTAASANPVVINELQASNTSTAKDEKGEYDDWVELYNNSTATVDISGYYLSDDAANLKKWQFPTGSTIAPNGYLIVWADENGTQGTHHASFKLSASGESVILTTASGELADQVTFGTLSTDMSYARKPNGTGTFGTFKPSFKQNNAVSTANDDDTIPTRSLSIFPNPVTNVLRIQQSNAPETAIQLFNVLGQSVWQGKLIDSLEIEVKDFPSGLYVLKTPTSTHKIVIVK